MLADAARTYLQQYGVAVGRRVVVVTAHDSGYRAAQELKAAGVEVVAIADIRSRPAPTGEAESAELRVLCGVTIEGTTGNLRVSSIIITAEGRRQLVAFYAVMLEYGRAAARKDKEARVKYT